MLVNFRVVTKHLHLCSFSFIAIKVLTVLSCRIFLFLNQDPKEQKNIFCPQNLTIKWYKTAMHIGSQVMQKKIQIVMRDGLQNSYGLIHKSIFVCILVKVNI